MTADTGGRAPGAVFKAPAKINWHLAIGGKRPDGYHEIFSLFETIDLCDRLTIDFSGAPGGLTLVAPAGIPDDSRNTIAKADAALRRLRPGLPAVKVRLEKEIPHEAGLGGGSSDAAAYLLALNSQLLLGLTPEVQARLALEAGSDVPFFLQGGRARVGGRGERIEWLGDAPPAELLLVKPSAGSSTAAAYGALGRPSAAAHPMPEIPLPADPRDARWLAGLHNDFEAVMPGAVTAPLRAIRERGGLGFLSGSGAASFGVFESSSDLHSACNELTPLFPFVRIVRTLGRNEYLRQFSRD